MNINTTSKKISIGVVAHVDAGKTTITEQMLYKCGVIKTVGRVDNGNTTTDGMAVERERGITIRSTTVSMMWKDTKINLLDTPGHVDFVAEVERSLTVLDGAILAISAREGVQAQTRLIFNALQRLKIPTILFINKVDRMGVNLEAIYEDIRKSLTSKIYFMNVVDNEGTKEAQIVNVKADDTSAADVKADDIGATDVNADDMYIEDLKKIESFKSMNYEQLALLDDNFMTCYLEGETDLLDENADTTAIRYFREASIYLVLHGAALHGLGVDELLESICSGFEADHNEELSVRVYKVDRDDHDSRRCFAKIFGGELRLRDVYPVYGSDDPYKVRKMALLNGATPVPSEVARAGDIVILYSDELSTESVLGDANGQRKPFHLAYPTLKANVACANLAERRKICEALDQLTDEDPFLDYGIHPVTDAIEIKLFGVVQREIIETILKQRFNIDTQIEEPTTIYKERPLGKAKACRFMYKDGNLLPATIGIEIEPLEVGSGFVYDNRVSFGDLKKPFQNAVAEGIEKGLENGLNGWDITDLCVRFVYSEFDSVNSTPADYRKLAPEVVRLALESVGTQLLEPILNYEINLPQYAVGHAIADVLKMRGTVEEPSIEGEFAILKGTIPVETSKSYNAALSDYTEGKGSFITSFKGYQVICGEKNE